MLSCVFWMYDSRRRSIVFSSIFIWLGIQSLTGQQLVIDSILYQGNKKTKNYIIRRELDFKVHDTIDGSNLTDRFKENRSRILNTGLFKDVSLNIRSWNTDNHHVTVLIHLEEAWYIYPVPIFDIADRNFNVWWNEFNGSLTRVNYGMKFVHANLLGQQDALKITAQLGYSPKFNVEYAWPFFGIDRAWRFNTELYYSRNKESYYNTIENKLVFHKSELDYPLQRFKLSTSLDHRITLQLFQSMRIEFQSNQTNKTISEDLNPDFFLSGKQSQQFLSLRYNFIYDDRDLKYYPSKGRYFDFHITKEGIGNNGDINTLASSIQLDQYIPWNDCHNAGIAIKARASIIRDKIPYYNSRGLGFGENYLKGYEYFVIDGMDFLYLKFRERFIFLSRNIQFRSDKKLGIKSMPFKMSISSHASTGYVNNVYYAVNNILSNRWIYSYGLSLECLISNTSLIRLDWSTNHLKQSGFYLHFRDQF